MFDGLQQRFSDTFRKLKGEARITEGDLAAALREIRVALLEADVHFRVVKELLGRVEERAQGAEVLRSLNGSQQVIAIVREASLIGGKTPFGYAVWTAE